MSFSAFGFKMLDKLGSNLSDTYGTGKKLRDTQREENQADYLERERLGIVNRIEGAKAAGIHPLVAMNYQGGNSPTSVIGGSSLGSYTPEVQRDEPDPNIDRYNAARARLAEAEASKAEMDLAASRRALATQPGQPVPAAMPTSPANLSGAGLKAGVKVKPDEVTAGVGGVTAGRHPGASDVDVPGYGRMRVPTGPLKESLEDNELAATAMLLALNRQRWFEYLTDDIPWAIGLKGALRGSMSSSKPSPLKFGAGRRAYRRSPPKGGATGSW